MSVILVIQEAEIRGILVGSQPRQTVCETSILKKTHCKNKLVECLEVWALNSNPSTEKKKKSC
jgi:hypothetical protein